MNKAKEDGIITPAGVEAVKKIVRQVIPETVVINLYGAPGAGKSTGAAYIFSQMKMAGLNVELVTEFAKDLVWENRTEAIENQIYLLGVQTYRLSRLRGKVDYIINDSPIALNAFYPYSPYFQDDMCLEKEKTNRLELAQLFMHRYFPFSFRHPLDFFIKRAKPFNPKGRIHDQETAAKIEERLLEFLDQHHLTIPPDRMVKGDEAGYNAVLKDIFQYDKEVKTYDPDQ